MTKNSPTFQTSIIDVILKMVTHYQEKHRQSYKPSKMSKRIFLGRSRSASDTFEESLAFGLLHFLKEDRVIYIDAPMSMANKNGVKKSETIYPDILIVDKDNQLRGIIELKIDLGWLSDEWSEKRRTLIRTLHKKQLSIKRGETKIKIEKDYQYLILVLSQINDHGRWQKSFKKDHRGYAFLLLDGSYPHPNDRKKEGTEAYDSLKTDRLFIDRCKEIEEIIAKM